MNIEDIKAGLQRVAEANIRNLERLVCSSMHESVIKDSHNLVLAYEPVNNQPTLKRSFRGMNAEEALEAANIPEDHHYTITTLECHTDGFYIRASIKVESFSETKEYLFNIMEPTKQFLDDTLDMFTENLKADLRENAEVKHAEHLAPIYVAISAFETEWTNDDA